MNIDRCKEHHYTATVVGTLIIVEFHAPSTRTSATFSFRIRLPSTRIRQTRQRIRKKINPLCRVEKNKYATNPITCGRVNPDIFLSDDVKSVSSLSPTNKPIWRYNVEGEQSKFPATISLSKLKRYYDFIKKSH